MDQDQVDAATYDVCALKRWQHFSAYNEFK